MILDIISVRLTLGKLSEVQISVMTEQKSVITNNQSNLSYKTKSETKQNKYMMNVKSNFLFL